MTRPGLSDACDLPIGRQLARWRVRRGLTQQMLADRLGKSKSWVDKVERGVRALDRYSVIQEIAEVLHLDPAVLLGNRRPPPTTAPGPDGVDGVRAALVRHHHQPHSTVPPEQVRRHIGHAWLTYQHAHYAPLLRALPDLLDAAHGTPNLLVPTYRITAHLLIKLGEADLAWLAADRAAATATDPTLTGTATVTVVQALRALGRDRLALTAALTAADTTTNPPVRAALLLQAALAAARTGDNHTTHDLLDHATHLANQHPTDHDPHHTTVNPIAVRLARSLAAHHLGQPTHAVHLHQQALRHDDWPRLPAEHRAAHLLDAAHAYHHTGDHTTAARTLTDADTIAPAEIRLRPHARTLITEITRNGPPTAAVTRLATLIGLTR
ncbi:helix-turn-helix domain-containing protein [Micromonospora yangpuensis]|uniref:Helix-turn-helix domain-containing protein n=1 Tax=Micromonospora yangpuensis TaxID=683228 RepID=A0A1C6UMU0_9ACTN|nr:helix-turn-helix transcriptional regulator [Micromonospora yangpuensis]GGM27837.1 hypothetical protein GCM10012279_53030 [Micromonospora yangpuensis]SCL55209.1 Helix-turn-helix domain-containing protein [Micromonospora yangpuensis]